MKVREKKESPSALKIFSLLWTPLIALIALTNFSCSTGRKTTTLQDQTSLSQSTTAAPHRTEVVIIGAGLSGLATAYELKKQGIPYHILEILPKIGGRVRTMTYNVKGETLTADSGMEEYWESNPAVALLQELKLPLRHDIAISSLVLEKKLFPLTGTAEEFYAKTFNEEERLLLQKFKDFVAKNMTVLKPLLGTPEYWSHIPSELRKLKDITFSDWVKYTLEDLSRHGTQPTNSRRLASLRKGLNKTEARSSRNSIERLGNWIRISVECEIGTEWTKISALDGLAELHIFLGHHGEGEESYRVIGGNAAFTSALSDAVGAEHISVNKRVTRILDHKRPDGSHENEVVYIDLSTNEEHSVFAKNVVSTIPIFRLFEVQMDPPLSPKKWQAIQSQTYGSYFKAHVFVAADQKNFWTSKQGDSILPILSDSNLGVIYDGNPDQKDSATRILSLLITGARAEAFNFMPLDQVRMAVKSEFEQLWPGFAAKIQGFEFHRYHPRAIASWPVGRSRFDELSDEIRRPEHGVHLAGDFTESSHSDGAFLSARRVVGLIAKDFHK